MKSLPSQPETPNVRVLAQEYREEFTGLTTAVVTLANAPLETVNGVGLELVFKNGALVAPSTYTIDANVITLGSALIAGDVVVVRYPFRS